MRTLAVAACAVLALSAGVLAQTSSPPAARALTRDHYVAVKSTVPALKGQTLQLYARERVTPAVAAAPNLENRVVLFVHGAGTPAEVGFDVPHSDYSWMGYLAEAGFDVFAMDVTGYGRSTRTAIMDDPCNLAAQEQTALFTRPACASSSTHPFTTAESDWNDIGAVVDYIRVLRHVQRVSLVAWSLGGPRVGGYTLQNAEKVNRLVLLAPAYGPTPNAATVTAPFGTQTRTQFIANWDRQVGCGGQYDPAVRDAVWSAMLESDPVGATWGPGVRRAPNAGITSAAWQGEAGSITIPTLLVSGIHDKQVDPSRVRQLYAELGAKEKVFIDLGCSSHNAMWEKNHLLLFDASKQWLMQGSVNGITQGVLQLGYQAKRSTN